ncbi:hypothetical protein PENARI_c349G07070, partial [Penicillium arizonense]
AFQSNRIAISGKLSLPAWFQLPLVSKHSLPLSYSFLLTLIGRGAIVLVDRVMFLLKG